MSYIAPHPPFAAAREWLERIDPAQIPLAPPLGHNQADHPLLAAYRDLLDLRHFVPNLAGAPHLATPEIMRTIRHAYAALAAEVDHHIGRVIAALKAAGLWDSTIIVFSGDHGEQLFDHGLLGKLGWYDASAHIPLIIRVPNQTGGSTVANFTEAIDLFPTLVELLGLEADINLDGASLVPFLHGQSPAWRDAAHWSHDFRNLRDQTLEQRLNLPSQACNLHVVRTKDLKYVHFPALPPVLYNLREDPHETVNLASDAAARGLKEEGLARLLNQRLRHENEELSCFQAVEGQLYGARSLIRGAWPGLL